MTSVTDTEVTAGSLSSGSDRADALEARPSEPNPLLGPPRRPDFRTLFDAECGYVWNSLRRLGVAENDIEDVAHDVFVTVHRRLDTYDPARALRPWLFGITYRVASDFRRLARHRRERIDDSIEPIDEAPAADERMESAQARALVLRALDSLDLDRRAIFVMHELDGIAIPAVAQTLGIPVNTAYSRLRLSREQFAITIRRLCASDKSALNPLKQGHDRRT
ncbi:MAG: hypothetical protein NVS3B20_22780 [Polyangiales bacterium]